MADSLELRKRKIKIKLALQESQQAKDALPTPEETEREEMSGIKAFVSAISPTAVDLFTKTDAQKAISIEEREKEPSIVESITGDPLKPVISITSPVAIPPDAKVSDAPSAEEFRAVGEVLDVPRRAFGALVGEVPGLAELVGRKEGQDFLAAMADENTGIFKKAKAFVNNSDAPGAAKFMADLGLTVVEDPLFLLSGIFRVSGALVKQAATRATRETVATAGVKASGDIAEKSTVLGVTPKPRVSPELKFTQTQQLAVEGKPIPKSLMLRERKALGTTKKVGVDVKVDLDAGNFEAVADKFRDIRTKFRFSEDPVEALRTQTNESLGVLKNAFDSKMKSAFSVLDNKLDEFGAISEDALGIVTAKIDDVTKRSQAKVPTTPEEIADAIRREEFDVSTGQFLGDTGGVKSAAQLRVKSATLKRLKDLETGLGEGVTFSVLKEERSKLGNFLWGGLSEESRSLPITDYKMLKDVYKGLTDAMENVVKTNLGDDVLAEWKSTNRIFSAGEKDFKIAQRIMNKKSPDIIIADLASKSKSSIEVGIKSLKRVMPEENFETFKNMYFNQILKKATKKGNVDGDALTKVLKEQPAIVFNEVFDEKMIDDLIDAGQDAKAAQVARDFKIKADPSESDLSKISNNPWLRLAIFRKTEPTQIIASEVARTVGSSALKRRGATKAEDFLRQVDEISLFPQFLLGQTVGTIATVGKAAALSDPSIELAPELR